MSREQMRTPSVVDNGIHYSTNFDTNNTPRDNIQLLIQSMNESSPSLEHRSTLQTLSTADMTQIITNYNESLNKYTSEKEFLEEKLQ